MQLGSRIICALSSGLSGRSTWDARRSRQSLERNRRLSRRSATRRRYPSSWLREINDKFDACLKMIFEWKRKRKICVFNVAVKRDSRPFFHLVPERTHPLARPLILLPKRGIDRKKVSHLSHRTHRYTHTYLYTRAQIQHLRTKLRSKEHRLVSTTDSAINIICICIKKREKNVRILLRYACTSLCQRTAILVAIIVVL